MNVDFVQRERERDCATSAEVGGGENAIFAFAIANPPCHVSGSMSCQVFRVSSILRVPHSPHFFRLAAAAKSNGSVSSVALLYLRGRGDRLFCLQIGRVSSVSTAVHPYQRGVCAAGSFSVSACVDRAEIDGPPMADAMALCGVLENILGWASGVMMVESATASCSY